MASAATTARAATAAPASAPEVYTIDKGHSEATFRVRHLVTKVRGRFKEFSGTIRLDRAHPERSFVEFSIDAASIDTDVPDRDTHLKSPDFFDVAKFPSLTFASSRIVPAGGDRYEVKGTLTMRGIQKEITLPVTFLGFAKDPWGNEKAGFEFETKLNRKDFGMVWNAALDTGGFILGDEVTVSINLETLREKAPSGK
jgi:polyisoprenoid-binding protein YceI